MNRSIKITIIICLSFLAQCRNESHEKKQFYYPSGVLQSELSLRNGILDGQCKYYFENGNIFLEANYNNGKRSGKQKQYYDKPNSLVKYEESFVVEDEREKVVERIVYGEDGYINFHTIYTENEIKIKTIRAEKDSIQIHLSILQPKHEFTYAYIGNFDGTNIRDTLGNTIRQFQGNNNEIIFKVGCPKRDTIVTGYVKDFTIKPINDTLGYTFGENTFFSFTVDCLGSTH
jgi:hypothetical protein